MAALTTSATKLLTLLRNHPFSKEPLTNKICRLGGKSNMLEWEGVHLVTNEFGQKAIATQLLEHSPIKEGCHIGFSGWHNFNLMALRLSSRGIICDINPQNEDFIRITLNLIILCKTREHFAKRMREIIEKKILPYKVFEGVLLESKESTAAEQITDCLEEEGCWLGSDVKYNHIRSLAIEGKIAIITQDICNTATFTEIRKLLIDNDIPIDTLYISNIADHILGKEDKESFVSTVNVLSEDDTFIIAAEKEEDSIALVQTMKRKKDCELKTWLLSFRKLFWIPN